MKRKSQTKSQPRDYYPVQAIRKKRYNNITNNFEYFIKWEGWAEKYNTWEPISNIVGCQSLIQSFENQNKFNTLNDISTGQTRPLNQSITQKLSHHVPKQNFHDGIQMFLKLLNAQMQKRSNQSTNALKTRPPTKLTNYLMKQEKKSLKESINNKQTHLIINQQLIIKQQQKNASLNKRSSSKRSQRSQSITHKKNTSIQNDKNLNNINNKEINTQTIDTVNKKVLKNNKIQDIFPELNTKGHKVSQKQISLQKVKIIDTKMRNGKLNYLIIDQQNKCVPIFITKDQLIQMNPYVLLKFYSEVIN